MKLDLKDILEIYSKEKENFSPEILLEEINDEFQKAEKSYLIGLEFYNNNILYLSEKFFKFSIGILEKLNKKLELSYLFHSLASLKSKTNLDEAKNFFEKSLLIKKELGDNIGIYLVLKDLAYLEETNNNISNSVNLYKECMKYSLKENLIEDTFNILIKLSDLDYENNKNYLGQALYISLNTTVNFKNIIILITKFIKIFGIEDNNIPLIISTLSLIYRAKNLIDEDTNKMLLELISSCAVIRNITDISKWIKYEKFDDIELSLKRLEVFINDIVTDDYISFYLENKTSDNK
jgi:hypothetical protein